MRSVKPIAADSSIYIDSVPKGFSGHTYRYNVNHPLIGHLYARYKTWRGLPQSMPISDTERQNFERHIDKMIAEGKIVVKK